MRTSLQRFMRFVWAVLSEVPGWPDAPFSMRLRRLLPLLVPCAALLALGAWNWGVYQPHQQAIRAEHAPLVSLEEEIAALRLSCSDQQAEELAKRAEAVTNLLLPSIEQAPLHWRMLADEFRTMGWEASFQAYDMPTDDAGAGGQVVFAAARARLTAAADNPTPFPSLLRVLTRFSTENRRMDLTRLVVHADETGRPSVELNARVACRLNP